MTKLKVAIIGTNGVPSKYGGFETLVEYLVEHLSKEFKVTVFCSLSNSEKKLPFYKGAKLEYLPLSANNWQSIPYDIISLIKSYQSFDKVLILGASGCIVLPLFRKHADKFIFNFGGLDWQRSKWGYFTKKFLKLSEALGVKYSHHLVADNVGIQDYISQVYNRKSTLIAYGGDQAFNVEPGKEDIEKYPFLGSDYIFTVARIQPDNNIEMLLNAFGPDSTIPFVFVGNWKASTYGIYIKKKYGNAQNIFLLDAIYDQKELNLLRSNCKIYLHGHSAGGTNPALVEAMNLSLPIFCYDNVFNRHTTLNKAKYFSNSVQLSMMIHSQTDEDLKKNGIEMYQIAQTRYQWKIIANQYADLIKI